MVKRLAGARALIERVTQCANDWTRPLAYRAHYLAAIADLYEKRPKQAMLHIRELEGRLSEQWWNEDLSPMLRKLKPAVEALHQSARVLEGGAPDLCSFQARWVPLAAEYNLACVYNRWADMAVQPGDRRTRRRQALEHVSSVIARKPGLRAEAKLDPALQSIRTDKDADIRDRWNELVKDPPSAAKANGDRGDRMRDALRDLIAAATSA